MTTTDTAPCDCSGARCALAAGDDRHGTATGYGNSRCRCWDCCYAWAAYSVTARHARRNRGLPAGDPRHGTDNGYTNYNCRCEPCKDARSELRKRAA
jgi:hypothetical protein